MLNRGDLSYVIRGIGLVKNLFDSELSFYSVCEHPTELWITLKEFELNTIQKNEDLIC